jgi:thermitase
MSSTQRLWLLIGALTATLVGYLGVGSFVQNAETQAQNEARQGTENPTYAEGSEEQAAPDRIIVKLEENASRSDLEEINEENNASTEKDLPRSQVNVVDLPRDLPVGEAIETYEADPNVEFAEPDFVLRPAQTTPANDSYYPRLYGLNNTGQNGGIQDADVDAPEAWKTIKGNTDTVVAVIDEGVDINHPDLRNNIWTNPGETTGDGIDNDRNGYIDDVNGWDFYNNDASVYDPDPVTGAGDEHGTHVAGTIAAEDNTVGVVGVNWQAKIMPLKFLGPTGGYTSDAVEALNYAVSKGVKISNNSWGGGGRSQSLQDAITRADAAGHLFVAAAGNEGVNNDSTPHYPSNYTNPNVISVAATNNQDALADFSNYGATSVDLSAPGVSIYSTLPRNTYAAYSGTSMATPHVAGVAALLKNRNPSADDAQLRDYILKSVDQKNNLQGRMVTGGRANAFGSLAQSAPEAIGPTVTSVRPASGGATRDRTPTITATVSDNRTDLENRSIRLYVDGREITNFTYDQANDRVSYTSSRLSYGEHTVRIDVMDADLNTTTEDWSFRIRR